MVEKDMVPTMMAVAVAMPGGSEDIHGGRAMSSHYQVRQCTEYVQSRIA